MRPFQSYFSWVSITIKPFSDYRRLAKTRASTRLAPAARRTLVTALSVAPVVATSSVSKIFRPAIARGSRTK